MPRSSRLRKRKKNRTRSARIRTSTLNVPSIQETIKAIVSGIGVGLIVVGLFSLGALRLLFMVMLFVARKLFPRQQHSRPGIKLFLFRKAKDTVSNEELVCYFADEYIRWKKEKRPKWRIATNVVWFLVEASYAKVVGRIQVHFYRSL